MKVIETVMKAEPNLSGEIVEALPVTGRPLSECGTPGDGSSAAMNELKRYDTERLCWRRFAGRVCTLQTYQEAVQLVQTARLKRGDGRYYRNLSVLVHTLSVPEDATREEKDLYLELIRCWRAHSAGILAPGALDRLEAYLLSERQREWILRRAKGCGPKTGTSERLRLAG